jgi:hypothetical protein
MKTRVVNTADVFFPVFFSAIAKSVPGEFPLELHLVAAAARRWFDRNVENQDLVAADADFTDEGYGS